MYVCMYVLTRVQSYPNMKLLPKETSYGIKSNRHH